MTDDYLSCVTLEPRAEALASVVWLHGLGADGHDFEGVVPHLGLGPRPPVRFVFPNAPSIPVTVNGGMVMPAWYDITHDDLGKRHDAAGIRASAGRVARLLDREQERGVPPERTVLAGFSQGGAIALYLGLRHPLTLAGILALSTYLVWSPSEDAELDAANRTTPVFIVHGRHDPLVPVAAGEAARDRLRDLGYAVSWESYAMQHQVCMEEIQAVGAWLRKALGLSA